MCPPRRTGERGWTEVSVEVLESDEFAVSRLEKKNRVLSLTRRRRERRKTTTTTTTTTKKNPLAPSRTRRRWHAVVVVTGISCKLPVTELHPPPVGEGRETRFQTPAAKTKSVSLGRRGRGHPGVRFPAPELRYGKHKNCNEKRASSRQSVTCGKAVKNVREKQCADAARRGSVGSQTRARRVERSVSHPVVPASIGPRPRRPRGFERMPPSFVVF